MLTVSTMTGAPTGEEGLVVRIPDVAGILVPAEILAHFGALDDILIPIGEGVLTEGLSIGSEDEAGSENGVSGGHPNFPCGIGSALILPTRMVDTAQVIKHII